MDCNKLQSDIKELESLRDSLSSSLDTINETGKGRIDAKANQKQAKALEAYKNKVKENKAKSENSQNKS